MASSADLGQPNATQNHITGSQFLYPPTGPYSVGYEDFHWVNNNVCPDPFFNGKNQADFSPNNPNHCREIMARVYYPSSVSKQDPAKLEY